MNIELAIEQLIIEGRPELDRSVFRRVVQTELTRLLTENPQALRERSAPRQVAAAEVVLEGAPAQSTDALGLQVAAAIHRSITS